MSVINFPTTGDRFVDLLSTYALMHLTLSVDGSADIEWSLGRDIILKLHTYPQTCSRVIDELKHSRGSTLLASNLNFRLNVGGSWQANPRACFYCLGSNQCDKSGNCGKIAIPAYAVFYSTVDKIKELTWSAHPIQKNKKEGLTTLYLGLSPYWSKGIRVWDSIYKGFSAYVPPQILALVLYGIANYTIHQTVGDSTIILAFSPPCGLLLQRENAQLVLSLAKRLVGLFGVSIKQALIEDLPSKLVPLLILSQVDLPAIAALLQNRFSLIFVVYDMPRGYPLNPRRYEELSLIKIATFSLRLGPVFWDFRCMVDDLARCLGRHEYRSRAESILLDLVTAISTSNPWSFNNALLKANCLNKELDKGRIHLLDHDSLLKAQCALRG